VIAGSPPEAPEVRVLGAIRGFVPDALKVVEALDEFRPTAVGVGASPEELRGFQEAFGVNPVEPFVNLYPNEAAEARELARFGEVHLPRPAVDLAIRWASEHGASIAALDPSDEVYGDMFTQHVGYFALVGRTVRERRLTRRPPKVSSPDELVLRWDAELNGGRGTRGLAWAREQAEAEGILDLHASAARVAAIVDRERFDGVLGAVRSLLLAEAKH
jgi:hypothetical protein